MLVKDCINTVKINSMTQKVNININFSFDFNGSPADLKIDYRPYKDHLEQISVLEYVNNLKQDKDLSIEDLASKITEDLYDLAIPTRISLCLTHTVNDITTTINTQKDQPKASC